MTCACGACEVGRASAETESGETHSHDHCETAEPVARLTYFYGTPYPPLGWAPGANT
jgi:hypothetical protein